MIKNAVIIPTGNEIFDGIVIDTNSPCVMGSILEKFPQCRILRETPVKDTENDIAGKVKQYTGNADLIFLLGGTGGGHRFDKSLAFDYSHSAILSVIPDASYRELYGSNGHMWSKLIVGKKDGTIVITLPGPYAEAKVAAQAAVRDLAGGIDSEETLADHVAEAVLTQYPSGGNIK